MEIDRIKRRFMIYDMDKNLKYQAKNSIVSAKKHIYLMDAEGRTVGSVKEKLLKAYEYQTYPFDFLLSFLCFADQLSITFI